MRNPESLERNSACPTAGAINTSEYLGDLGVKGTQRAYRALLVVLAITLLLCIGFVAARGLINAAMGNDVQFSPAQGSSTPSAIGSLLAGNTSAEIGDMVFLNNVRLQAGPTPDLFVVSGRRGAQMLMSLEASKEFQAVPGDVDIKGTIRRLPALEVLRKGWRLSKDQLHFFGRQHVYIAAEYVKEQNRDATNE
ncbi:MAG: hypothetical protein WA628_12960 [Terriglobales bacterium]